MGQYSISRENSQMAVKLYTLNVSYVQVHLCINECGCVYALACLCVCVRTGEEKKNSEQRIRDTWSLNPQSLLGNFVLKKPEE